MGWSLGFKTVAERQGLFYVGEEGFGGGWLGG